MCGIVGYTGSQSAYSILTDGLRRLTYRGYDSAGVVVDGSRVRTTGDVSNLPNDGLTGTTGIGHTRWATHGKPTEENAHPHTDPSGTIYIVHNGIIENADTLREKLSGPFESNTDTEVIAHLISQHGLDATIDKLDGQYAFVVSDGSDRLYCVRQYCPLALIDLGHGTAVASDVAAVDTDEAVFLETNDIATLTPDGWTIENNSEQVTRIAEEVQQSDSDYSLDGYDHYTIKEIFEEQYAIKRVPSPDALETGRIHLIGSGSSATASEYGAQIARANGYDASAWIASEYDPCSQPDCLIAVSQSGETADVLTKLRDCDTGQVIAVTNGSQSTLAKRADRIVDTAAGPEYGVASTKTWVNSILSLQQLFGNQYNEGAVIDDCLAALNKADDIYSVAKQHHDAQPLVILGSGNYSPIASDGEIKLHEIAYNPAHAVATKELKHGRLALIDDDSFVIGCEKYDTALSEIEARGAETMNLDEFGPIGTITWLYLFAYHVGDIEGRAIDRPRNLAKSVTVQ